MLFERNKSTVDSLQSVSMYTSSLLWLFRPPTPTNIAWRWSCQKNQSKLDPLYHLRENCQLSSYQKHLQKNKTQEIVTLLVHETPLNVTLSAAKIRFAQSKIGLVYMEGVTRLGGVTHLPL